MAWATASARWGSPGRSTRSASGAVGRRWMGVPPVTAGHHRLRGAVAERRDIPDALRDAVERTVQATVETRGRAQGAVDDITGSVDELVKGAEKNLTQRRRSVRAAVGKGLPATQDDVKELRTELRRIARRLEAIEERLPATKPKPTRSKAKKPRSAGS